MFIHDPVNMEAERIQQIVEAKYSPADLEKIVAECSELTLYEQSQLLKLLKKFSHLFDGTLGTWKTDPVKSELKDPKEKLIMQNPILCHMLMRKNSGRKWKD